MNSTKRCNGAMKCSKNKLNSELIFIFIGIQMKAHYKFYYDLYYFNMIGQECIDPL